MVDKLRIAFSIAPALLVGWPTVAASHEHQSTYSAGEPGDPKKPSREIVVEMSSHRAFGTRRKVVEFFLWNND